MLIRAQIQRPHRFGPTLPRPRRPRVPTQTAHIWTASTSLGSAIRAAAH